MTQEVACVSELDCSSLSLAKNPGVSRSGLNQNLLFHSSASRRQGGAAALLAALHGEGAHAGVCGGLVQPAAPPGGQEAPPRAAGLQPPPASDGSGQQAGERDRKPSSAL